jgi:hypothetical protein
MRSELQGDAIEQEGHQRQFLIAREIGIHPAELRRVLRTVIGRYPHAQEQHLRSGRCGELGHPREILPHLRDRQGAQTVIAAELQEHDRGVVQVERTRQTREPACGRFAADAGIDDLVTVTFLLELRLQQCRPALFDARQPVTGADAVAEDEDHRRCGICRNCRQPQHH